MQSLTERNVRKHIILGMNNSLWQSWSKMLGIEYPKTRKERNAFLKEVERRFKEVDPTAVIS